MRFQWEVREIVGMALHILLQHNHIAAIDVAVNIRDDGPVYVRVMFRESELRLRASSKRSRLGSLYEKYKLELSERPAGDSSSEVV
jgi:hypothetical protein